MSESKMPFQVEFEQGLEDLPYDFTMEDVCGLQYADAATSDAYHCYLMGRDHAISWHEDAIDKLTNDVSRLNDEVKSLKSVIAKDTNTIAKAMLEVNRFQKMAAMLDECGLFQDEMGIRT
jgi:hypothetical protein